ncbi:MAG: sensor histidine kinase, partial [Acidimicrobiales bacterium]|nr:sensor histidine kinase [Acidimicrobiales bacterium]
RSTIPGDTALLSRAVTNLINNAVKFSDQGTEVDVEVSAIAVTISDRGPGIPDADLPFIFDRFYRATAARSAPGSGLGLAIVNQIVAGHGGTVHASNRADGGAQIGFSLPVVTTA